MKKIATRKSTQSRKKKSLKAKKDKLARAEARVEDIEETINRLVFCIYARNGQGKTTFGASGEKPIIIDAEGGTPSIRKHKDAKRFRVETWTDIDLIYWYLKTGKHDRKTVVIDTVTALAALCMKFVLGDEASRDPTKDPDMPTKREWGKVGELMKTVIMNFLSLENMNVVFLAQERKSFIEDDSDELPEVYPDLSASSRSMMTAHANIIGRMYTKRVVKKDPKTGKKKKYLEHRMLVAPHDIYLAKVNIEDHGLPDVIKEPTIPKIMDMIAGTAPETPKPKKKKKSTAKKKGKVKSG